MKNNVLKWLGRVGATLLTTIVILVVGLYLVMAMLGSVAVAFTKIIVDLCLFVISYNIQKKWVFK